MESVVLVLSMQQPPGHDASNVMIIGAAILILLALRFIARSLQPVVEVIKSAAAMGLAVLLTVAALVLVVMSLFL
ncbi:hypothetical protein FB565_003188 [Actinoplanes lutulentus]|uniref:Uncharacterized protein n=1 Tax=Actinoplanes lutulentus TaxID=1287878 RepID=A0A327Z5M6_9ACTN|nr:hypothetical protein [Actinoplanes lutulentus]MBB2943475.1 hypothetical protein [Actinoplanes lutulentus]RAK26006.1 hypothetical protein B0I29_12942 [Actinoplanes lutulentus]